MTVVHIVLFQFRSLDTLEEVQEVIDGFLALNTACIHPQTNKPYIKVIGGRELGPEGGMQDEYTHHFMLEIASKADLKYYMEQDPAHLAFIRLLEGKVAKTLIVDFTPGVF